MALEKIMPDDINEVMCGLLAYISEGDKAAGAKMSYGDFGKHLAQEYGRNYHGCNDPNGCFISGTPTKVEVETSEGTKYELTWNKVAKFIHPYLKSTTVSETVETDTPTPAVNTPTDTAAFDYSAVDEDTANYLRKATARIANSYADIGAVLAEAQERLAKHGFGDNNGFFEKWYSSLGMSKKTVYRFIQIHNFRNDMLRSCQIDTNENALEIFDNLPKTLQADISSPSAPAEAVNAILSGDITTHKDFIAMKKQLEEVQAENEQLTEKNRFLSMDYNHEKERNERMLDELKEFREKSTALEVELKQAQSEAREVIMTDPKTTEEYRSLKDDYDKIARQVIATTQERDHLRERCDELYHQTQETPAPVYVGGADIEEIEKFTDELAGSIDAAVITFFRYYKEGSSEAVKDIFRRKADYIKTRIDNLAIMYLDDDD